jgi:hypothetical protein
VGVLSDRLGAMQVRVISPNRQIAAELRNGSSEVSLSFAPGTYRRFDERTLEGALADLGKLLWVARMKEYYAAVSEAFGETVTGEPTPETQRDREYRADRARLIAEGSSRDRRVRLAVRGMETWTVRIAAGTVRALTEEEFAARVSEAAHDLIADQKTKIWQMKQRHYGQTGYHQHLHR